MPALRRLVNSCGRSCDRDRGIISREIPIHPHEDSGDSNELAPNRRQPPGWLHRLLSMSDKPDSLGGQTTGPASEAHEPSDEPNTHISIANRDK